MMPGTSRLYVPRHEAEVKVGRKETPLPTAIRIGRFALMTLVDSEAEA